MGVVGEIDRLAISAWAPAGLGGGYIACGTYAGAIDPSFASGASLELLSVDIQNSRLSVATECKTSEKFCSLAWGYPLRAHPAGLVAGGLSDGTVRIWDAAVLLRSPKSASDDEERGVVFGGSKFTKKHESAVRGVCFNPRSPHMLASGGADTKIFVWDLSNPTQGPSLRSPGAQQVSSGPSDEVTALQWNLRVAHILGSGTAAGVLRIWDLKQRRQVISIPSPSSRMRCSGIHWHPEIATQVLTTCNQDNGYGALLWDLRSPSQPVVAFNDFASRGIASASWCAQDSEMILFSTREPRNVIVSASTGQILSDLQSSSSSPNFDVQWSPRIPGLFLTSSIDARLTVKSLLTADSSRSVSVETANALAESFGEMATGFESGLPEQSPRVQTKEKKAMNIARPPKWLCRPASLSFTSSGHYTVVSKSGDRSVTVVPHRLSLSGLKECLSDLEKSLSLLSSGDPSAAENLCRKFAKSAELKEDVMGFEVLCCLLQRNSRQKLLQYLGYSAPEQEETVSGGMSIVYGLPQSVPIASPIRTLPPAIDPNGTVNENIGDAQESVVVPSISAISGPAPWDDVGNDQSESILDDESANMSASNGHGGNDVSVSGSKGGSTPDYEGLTEVELNALIRKSVVVGDLKKAVEACLFAGRMSDALVIAQAGGPALWYQAQSHYLASLEAQTSRNVIAAVTGPVSKMLDLMTTVDGQSKDAWKEALAMVLTYVPGSELAEKCTALGQRLLLDGRNGPALACFLCAGNTKLAITAWKGDLHLTNNAVSASQARVEGLASLVRKIRLLTVASLVGLGESNISSVRALDEVSGSVLCEIGGLLALSGDMEVAATYVSNLETEVNGVYGTAGDILAMVSSAQSSSQFTGNTQSITQDPLGARFDNNISGYGGSYGEQQYYATPGPTSNWSQPPHGSVVPPPPAPIAQSPTIQPTNYPSRPETKDRAMFDPYANAPSYGTTGYAPPPLPAAPAPAPPPSASTTPAYAPPSLPPVPRPILASSYGPPSLPPAPVPSTTPLMGSVASAEGQMQVTPSASVPTAGYASVSPMQQPLQPMTQQQPMQPMPPPPPPPPSSDTQLPTSYHVKAKPGDGQRLPPSAEVAVFEERRSKQSTASSTGGGPPRRSHSSSSSLSSVGSEPAPYLDKADPSSVPSEQQIIVKSLRGAFSYAVKRNNSMMYRKKMEDVNKKLGRLIVSLNKGTIESNVIPHLIEIGQFIEKGKYDSASIVVGTLMSQHWDNNSQWIQALKRLIDCVLNGR